MMMDMSSPEKYGDLKIGNCSRCDRVITERVARRWKRDTVATFHLCYECDKMVEQLIREKHIR